MKTAIRNLALSIAVLFMCASTVTAEDFDEKKELENQSRNFIMAKESVPLLKLVPGQGNAAILDKTIEHFSMNRDSVGAIETDGLRPDSINTDNNSFIEYGIESCIASNNGVVLIVSGDGTKVQYMNEMGFEDIKKRNGKFKRNTGKISKNRLEALGRTFIENSLSEFIKIDENEEIVPFNVIYEIDTEYNANTEEKTESVTGNIVIFSRKVNGHHVIGKGSKISIMFANDETPVAFRYDWPDYQAADMEQKIISKENLIERKGSLSIMKESATDIDLVRFECGYYDPGAMRRDDESIIQAACAAFYHGKKEETTSAVMDIIPIGESDEVISDPYWAASQKLTEEGDMCESSSDVNNIPLTDVDVESE